MKVNEVLKDKYKYLLLVHQNFKIESYYDKDLNSLKEYAIFRKFKHYIIFELKFVEEEG